MALKNRQYDEDKRVMYAVVDELIAARRRTPSPDGARRDILDTILTATDPQTGQRLDDDNLRNQMVTFLVAGHETTSGLITCALYELLRHPDVLRRARDQVAQVLGTSAPRFEHLAGLG